MPTQPTSEALTKALASLSRYDWGSPRTDLEPIDTAVQAAVGEPAGRVSLEKSLVAALNGKASAVAKEFVCGKLAMIGSAQSAPALAALLPNEATFDAARLALEAIPGPEAATALREQLTTLTGRQLIGCLRSLGNRRDSQSVAAIVRLLKRPDPAVVGAAASALGRIGTAKAARALQAILATAPEAARTSLADACLECGESLRRSGEAAKGRALLEALARTSPTKQVQEAVKLALGSTAK
jgi:HEAT repeat protein